jgi:hypothetical protein
VPLKPGAGVLEAAAPMRPRRRTARPTHHQQRPRRLRPGHRRHANQGRCHAGAASRHGSTTSPPLARRQPTLTCVALACIYTHHTLTSPLATPSPLPLHRPCPADTFFVPARSPRTTRPSRRPRRSARPLVRPTSFMRTTTPRSLPARAQRTMSRLRCAQSLHCTSASAITARVRARRQQAAPITAPYFPKGTPMATAP